MFEIDPMWLVNFGVLGIWTVYLIWEKGNLLKTIDKMSTSLDKNTDILEKISYILQEERKK